MLYAFVKYSCFLKLLQFILNTMATVVSFQNLNHYSHLAPPRPIKELQLLSIVLRIQLSIQQWWARFSTTCPSPHLNTFHSLISCTPHNGLFHVSSICLGPSNLRALAHGPCGYFCLLHCPLEANPSLFFSFNIFLFGCARS